MNWLRATFVMRHCAFIIKMEEPMQTLKRLLDFICEKNIRIELMQMYPLAHGEAKMSLHCLVDKEKIKHVRHCLEKMKGILELELLETTLTEAR
jgi:ACT domain-containing protein